MATDLYLKLSKHFTAREFQCHDGSPIPDWFPEKISDTVDFLERFRGFMNFHVLKVTGEWKDIGLHVTSGYRTMAYQKREGIGKTTNHPGGWAADVNPTYRDKQYYYSDFTYAEFWKMALLVDKSFKDRPYRLGNYAGKRRYKFLHVDCRYGYGGRRWYR